ncbi:hypothetical protein FJZ53_02285 [Candidatus Woesearchaeota archaeon]|nr:hypothetical protein [Candidatus Woesearchaeota archaeon]
MLKPFKIFKKQLHPDKTRGENIEIAIPLASLLGLKLQGQPHQNFMSLVYSLIEEKPTIIPPKEEEKDSLETLIALEDVNNVIKTDCAGEKSLNNIRDGAIQDFDQKFNSLRHEYNHLEKDKAKTLINKSLHFLLSQKDTSLTPLLNAAEKLPIQKDSNLRYYHNWFLVGERLKQELNKSFEIIAKNLEEQDLNKPIKELKQELNQKSVKYSEELNRSLENKYISLLVQQLGLSKNEQAKALHSLATVNTMVLPKLRTVTDHTSKDLTDLIKYQFPDKDLYCIEEASNSKDAQAKTVKYEFFTNGLTIEDDGHGMGEKMFFEEYPFPYLSVKHGELNIGRFGAGAKAKLVEVLKNNGEVIVETKTRQGKALKQRYFMHDQELYISFSKSDKTKTGTKVTILSPKRSKEDEANQKSLIRERLSYFDPNKTTVISGKEKINRNSALKKEAVEDIVYKDEHNKTYFSTEKKGDVVLLSGGVLISKSKAPFNLIIEVPLRFQPVEGRNDFVYSEDLREYMAQVFRQAILPKLDKKSAEWFMNNNVNQNPFYQFEQKTSKEEIIKFYNTLYPEKKISQDTAIINLPKGEVNRLNSLTDKALFVKNRKHKPPYLLSIEEYSLLSEQKKSDKTEETKYSIQEAMAKHETGLNYADNSFMKRSRKITPVYLDSMNHDTPFYYNQENSMLLINMNHKAFRMKDEAKKSFYLSQMLRIATNG